MSVSLLVCVHVTVRISANVFASAHGCLALYLCGCIFCVCIYYSWSRLSPLLACYCLLTSSVQKIFKSLHILLIRNCNYIWYYITKVTPDLYIVVYLSQGKRLAWRWIERKQESSVHHSLKDVPQLWTGRWLVLHLQRPWTRCWHFVKYVCTMGHPVVWRRDLSSLQTHPLCQTMFL